MRIQRIQQHSDSVVSTIRNPDAVCCDLLWSIHDRQLLFLQLLLPEVHNHSRRSEAFGQLRILEVRQAGKGFHPKQWETIGDNPFAECASLTAIQLSKDNPNIVLIGSFLFNRDMEKLVLGCRTIEGHFDVPEGVKNIGADAFWDCSKLLSITMPRS